MQSNKSKHESGQSLLEVIVVLAVGVVVVGSLVFATIASLRNAQFARSQTTATKLAQEGLESVRSARNRNGVIKGLFSQDITWSDARLWGANAITDACSKPCYFRLVGSSELDFISTQNTGKELPAGAETLDTQFKRAVILEDDNGSGNSKKVTVVVSWNDFSGYHQSRLTTILRKL